jgi:hypothetical protein
MVDEGPLHNNTFASNLRYNFARLTPFRSDHWVYAARAW